MTSVPKRKKKNVPKSTSEMSKEMLMETLRKKKECNTRALAIVERLCEPLPPDENWLLTNLAFINQSHFEDVFVERAITKLCGYPLCQRKLENIPQKKYHISTRHNKVFDISERKNFCSANCFNAGNYVKNQLLTSPLWYRDKEIIPKFKLLPCSSSLGLGEEVVFFPEKEQLKKDILSQVSKEKDEVSELSEKLSKITATDDNDDDDDDDAAEIKSNSYENAIDPFKDKRLVEENVSECKNYRKSEDKLELPTDDSSISKRERKIIVDPVKKVEKCIYEWFTLKTVLYLFGENKVKEIMKDHKNEIKNILEKESLASGFNEKVDMMIKFYAMIEDDLFDSDSIQKDLKPLPDYSAIKEDGKKIELKVRAFFSGNLEINESQGSSNEVVEKRKEEEENEIYLPVIDSHAQNTLRIKILLQHFNKIIPELIRSLHHLPSSFEISKLRNLVSHFTLSSHNITFRPGEWNLISFIVIKLLSLKNGEIKLILESEEGKKHASLFLSNYGLNEDYLDRIIEWLMDPQGLIKKLN